MAEYKPVEMSMLLTSVLERAVPELLEQHHCYSEIQLMEFLSKYYPDIPEAMRGPVVVAATLGAKHAALMHAVAEKNTCSGNTQKRHIATEAASSLSFWALGMRPHFRSATPVSQASSSVKLPLTSPSKNPVIHSSVSNALTALSSVQLPVPLRSGDPEFEMLYSCSRQLAVSDLLWPISSAATSEVAVSAAPISFEAKPNQPEVVVIDEDSGCVESCDAGALNDVEPDSPLQLTAPDDHELMEDCTFTGPALITVSAPTTSVMSSVSITPAVMCPAVASLLAPRIHTAANSLAVSPRSERLLALSAQAMPAKTASTPVSVGKTKGTRPDDRSASQRRSTHQRSWSSTTTTSSKRSRKESENPPSRVVSMDEDEFRLFREFTSKRNKE